MDKIQSKLAPPDAYSTWPRVVSQAWFSVSSSWSGRGRGACFSLVLVFPFRVSRFFIFSTSTRHPGAQLAFSNAASDKTSKPQAPSGRTPKPRGVSGESEIPVRSRLDRPVRVPAHGKCKPAEKKAAASKAKQKQNPKSPYDVRVHNA